MDSKSRFAISPPDLQSEVLEPRKNDTFHAFEEMYNQMMMYVPR